MKEMKKNYMFMPEMRQYTDSIAIQSDSYKTFIKGRT